MLARSERPEAVARRAFHAKRRALGVRSHAAYRCRMLCAWAFALLTFVVCAGNCVIYGRLFGLTRTNDMHRGGSKGTAPPRELPRDGSRPRSLHAQSGLRALCPSLTCAPSAHRLLGWLAASGTTWGVVEPLQIVMIALLPLFIKEDSCAGRCFERARYIYNEYLG